MRVAKASAVIAGLMLTMAPLSASAASDHVHYYYDQDTRLTYFQYDNGTGVSYSYDTEGNWNYFSVAGTAMPLVRPVLNPRAKPAAVRAGQLPKPLVGGDKTPSPLAVPTPAQKGKAHE